MEEFKYLIPEESIDNMIGDVARLREVENTLRKIFLSHHYHEVLLPSFEYVELYTQLESGFTPEKMFQYINHEGKSVAMRVDFTIPIARLYASTAKDKEARYCYFGQVHRKERRHKGRSSEFFQAGIELINKDGILGDKECVEMIQESLQALPLKNKIVELGSAKFFNRLCTIVKGKKEVLTTILKFRDISSMKKFVRDNTFDDSISTLLLQLPTCFGDILVLEKAMDSIKDEILLDAMQELKEVYTSLKNKENIIFDLGMVPSMNYYTGIMIKGYSDFSASPIISGGRYDKLLPHFNVNAGAIGFCFHMNHIMQAMEKEEENND